MHRLLKPTLAILLILLMLSTMLVGCSADEAQDPQEFSITSFRDIPGITEEEIQAIELLQTQIDYFTYGMNQGTEAFDLMEGDQVSVGGFTAYFTEWLSMLFEIPFKPVLIEWGPLMEGLADGSIDFTGEMMATPARREIYFMTDAIAERTMHIFRLAGSVPLDEIALTRPVRYAFFEGSIAVNYVGPLISHDFEILNYENYEQVYQALLRGEVDGFFDANTGEAAFEQHHDIVKEDFLPIVYIPVSMTAQNPALEPIITVVQKALEGGALKYLTKFYNKGYDDYLVYKTFHRLTAEEIQFIEENPVITFGLSPTNYPIGFYNIYENEWQGISIDVLDQVSALTGLSFAITNDQHVTWSELLTKLEEGEIQMLVDLTRTPEREGRFLWPESSFLTSNYALLSKDEYPNIRINELLYAKVGLQKDSAQAELFRTWFPNLIHVYEFDTFANAFAALGQGEIDLLMADETRLLNIANYQEIVGYKANIVFDRSFDSTFAFNINEPVLTSIMEKVLDLLDTNTISNQWMRRSYDYRSMVAQARLPWLLGLSLSLLGITVLALFLFQIKRKEKANLAFQVEERTQVLNQQATELKALKEDLEQALQIAEGANNAKSEFLAKISHEMRTPLNAIIGLSELELCKENTEINESFERINNAGTTLLNIVNDILDISKIEAGKFELVNTVYDTASLIFDTININMLRIGEKNITFDIQVDEQLPQSLYGDELRIRQILNNILSNAFKYTNEGRVEFKVSGQWQDRDFWLILSISDTGIGFQPEQMNRLFTNYFQIIQNPTKRVEGTGLGLAITKKLCDHMNGTIELVSEYGIGSTFTITIPQEVMNEEVIGEQISKSLSEFTYNLKREKASRIAPFFLPDIRIMIVDDVISNLDVARGMMARYQMQIDCVTSGQEAYDLVKEKKHRYDAIFMDHMMPGIDGVVATEMIHAIDDDYARNIPVVALTANAIIGNEDMFLSKGFYAYLPKPIDIVRLDAIIRSLFKKEKTTERNFMLEENGSEVVSKEAGSGIECACDEVLCDEDLVANCAVDRAVEFVADCAVDHAADFDVDCSVDHAAEFVADCAVDHAADFVAGCSVNRAADFIERLQFVREIDVEQLLDSYEDDEDMISMIFASFVEHTHQVIASIEDINHINMKDYQIIVHGLKGSCNNIYALSLSKSAQVLEDAAKRGDIAYVKQNNILFIQDVNTLIQRIKEIL